MFEKEIQFITDFNLNKIKSLSSSFIFDELFRVELHPALIKYISGRVDFLIYEERKILLENSRFDYSGTKINEYFNLISDEIKKTKKLLFNEVEEYIKKGVIFNANFSVQPKATLVNLIFKNQDEAKSTAEIKVHLNFIYYYDYFKEIINSYISKKKIVSIGKEDFKNILDKVDSELLISKREDIIADGVNSISDFYNDGGITKSSIQPVFIETFLKEKNLTEIIDQLRKEVKDNRKKISTEELKKILFTKPVIKELPVEQKEIEEPGDEVKPETETISENDFELEIKSEPGNIIPDQKKDVNVKTEKEIIFENETEQEEIIEEEIKPGKINEEEKNKPAEDENIIIDDDKEPQELILEEEIIEKDEKKIR